MHLYTYIRATIISGKRDHEFEREQGKVYWREGKEGRDGVIILILKTERKREINHHILTM